MKKKLKLFKFITNIIAFSSLSLSVFGPLWHFQNTKSYSDFKLETRNIDLSNSKKPVNFDDLVQIVSTKNQQNSLVINANIKKAKTHLNKTSTNSDSPNLDDIEIQINQEGEVILNSASLELANKKAELYFEEGVPKLKLEGYVFDFRELQNQTRVEKTAAPAAVAAAPAAFSGLFWYAIGAAIVGIAAAYIFPNIVSDVGRWWNNNRSAHPVHKDDDSPITSRGTDSIEVDLDKLTKGKSKSRIKAIANIKTLRLSVVKDKKKLRNYTGIHPAWFFNFHNKDLESYFVISEQAIPETAAWFWAVSNLTMQSKLTQIVIDNLLPSSVKAKINKNKRDRENMEEKLNSPIDFYSYYWWVMKNLAEKTRDTANLIVGNRWSIAPNNNLNKDSGFTKDHFVVGEGLARGAIDWTDPKNEFDIDESKDKKIPSYIKIYFPNYHVRRLRMIGDKEKGIESEFIPRKKMLNVEKVHFLYGKAIRFSN
ncbi:hypothetical protein [Mesomycoplasma ovipneumoniae]|uniref:Transmembrane protein n=1 Tax=Mesomycoplasma ovipneumoniae TaxID=29562 RepID=A0AAP5Y3B4_9BACT|nr:hypothetical protein [Mesomycoplasma ovipneumoniae]MDW2910333.1 hypothetical protein [Mesomycoplasma ovipneumoniae]MDW2915116.1 hypothetical protein [Mesomycoplasma ovipneumoniae]MDW2916589.1 hypothetical protein [Mesomycoplasma ovipneumoniae]MDW2920845.1 hypothetical protein [Mesomycoplasma ovipneumoniae]MDW2927791.1 hypothetical protein [Mesomycoplasma ovipneumoniae]